MKCIAMIEVFFCAFAVSCTKTEIRTDPTPFAKDVLQTRETRTNQYRIYLESIPSVSIPFVTVRLENAVQIDDTVRLKYNRELLTSTSYEAIWWAVGGVVATGSIAIMITSPESDGILGGVVVGCLSAIPFGIANGSKYGPPEKSPLPPKIETRTERRPDVEWRPAAGETVVFLVVDTQATETTDQTGMARLKLGIANSRDARRDRPTEFKVRFTPAGGAWLEERLTVDASTFKKILDR